MSQGDKFTDLSAAAEYFVETVKKHPERNSILAEEAVKKGERRKHPCFYLNHLATPDDPDTPQGEITLPEVDMPDTAEGNLARELIGKLEPLKMLNPVTPAVKLGQGTGTLVTFFGIPVNPEADNTPAFTRPFEEVLSEDPPDPATAGIMPRMKQVIDMAKSELPPDIKISFPDMQGPFNIVHAITGTEALMAPYVDTENFHKLMDRVTTLWLGVRRLLIEWIGEDRLHHWHLNRITECSVNMVSPEMYIEHILPYDKRIADEVGTVHIHPCSGPHVFHVTLENLPVAQTEAGYIEQTAAGAISVDDALEAIGDRGIILEIGQELPEGSEYEFIKNDLDRYEHHSRLLFGYTGMHWRIKDRPMIRDMHKRLDDYWKEKYC